VPHATLLSRSSRARSGVKVPKGKQAYIKISEEEIADDYPMPKQYPMEEEEMDEFVVNGDEDMLLDVDPECLPKMARRPVPL
jgi:DNA (cytosine-5)-methyltransferase 1